MGCRPKAECHARARVAEGDAIQDVVGYRLAGVSALRACCRVDLGDTMEVAVQWGGMACSELDEEAGVASGEGSCECKELLRGEGVVDSSQWCGAR